MKAWMKLPAWSACSHSTKASTRTQLYWWTYRTQCGKTAAVQLVCTVARRTSAPSTSSGQLRILPALERRPLRAHHIVSLVGNFNAWLWNGSINQAQYNAKFYASGHSTLLQYVHTCTMYSILVLYRSLTRSIIWLIHNPNRY